MKRKPVFVLGGVLLTAHGGSESWAKR